MKTLFAKALILTAFVTLLSGCKEEALTATVRSGDTVIVSLSADDLGEDAGSANTAILRRHQIGAKSPTAPVSNTTSICGRYSKSTRTPPARCDRKTPMPCGWRRLTW
ncbi:hypothetical protein [Microbulbifer halophilus]|uniref:hypothetical protein n=1 Tax=Microbulbifer halophilus TaxID=453963 RepID=UPI0036237292